MERKHRTTLGAAAAAAGLIWGTGCATSIRAACDPEAARVDFGEFNRLPRARVGCLPFPGPMTLYSSAVADNLGEHCYDDPNGETSRGIVYTTRGGFLDVAHVRNAADMTAYLHARVSYAMHAGWGCVRFRGHEPSVYEVTLAYPESWADLDPAARLEVIDEAAVRLAQRLALEVMTWHEILTWYGYKSTGLVSESGSAFTYEDGPSHAVGVLIAGEALRAGGDFDARVTALLAQTLDELGVVGKRELRTAISAVDGDWWSGGKACRRHLETGLENGVVTPWLVPGLDFDDGSVPVSWEIPTLDEVMGHDCTGLAVVRIDPRVGEAGKLYERLGVAGGLIEPTRDFPVLIADIRAEVGPEFARIDPPDQGGRVAQER